jgi:hypothetical protein
MSAKMAAVDITPVMQERVDQFTLFSDTTSIPSSGNIRRVIRVTLTADFMTQFPTNDDKTAALVPAFKNHFQKHLPAQITQTFSLV